jgi:hypothetical protein
VNFVQRVKEDWKRNFAVVVLYGYAYDICVWPLLFWTTTLLTVRTGIQWPAPPLVPWEQLAVATANLAVIGTVQFLRDRKDDSNTTTVTEKSESTVQVKEQK